MILIFLINSFIFSLFTRSFVVTDLRGRVTDAYFHFSGLISGDGERFGGRWSSVGPAGCGDRGAAWPSTT